MESILSSQVRLLYSLPKQIFYCVFYYVIGNPVVSEEYSTEHNTEVLCGPINMMSSLDLSGSGGIVTLTSPSLLVSRSRTLLIHIKAIFSTNEKSSVGINNYFEYRFYKANSQSSKKEDRAQLKRGRSDLKAIKEQPTSADNQKLDFGFISSRSSSSQSKKELKGCDYLHEISITIRRSCRTNIPNERYYSK